MPRAAGQIDLAKAEAVLDAAAEVFAERGLGAPVDEVARRAGVSKQTIYNRYGGKHGLVKALVERRSHMMTAALEEPDAGEHLEDTLIAYARDLLALHLSPGHQQFLRVLVAAAADDPEMARVFYEAGPKASRERFAGFLARQARDGKLRLEDPLEAASYFGGMVTGHRQLGLLLGVNPPMSPEEVERTAQRTARAFLKACRA